MSVTAPKGFVAAGMHAGIKAAGVLDLALVASTAGPIPVSAVFTRCQTEAAPVTLSRQHAANGLAQAVVLNSGCANAGTGRQGTQAAEAMARSVAAALSCQLPDVLVCSTGAIGPQLPPDLPDAASALVGSLSPANGALAAEAILTTDTVIKQIIIEGDGWVIGGMAKGAGMIRPDMATMLAVLTTDAVVSADTLALLLSQAVDRTFNCLNVDGCQSTNDTVTLMASGASGVTPDHESFLAALEAACSSLARQMAEDAEGASRVVTMKLSGADSDVDAQQLGMAVADSALVRSSFYGGDPNWGRIYGALGVAGVPIEQQDIAIAYNGVTVAEGGSETVYDRLALLDDLAEGEIEVTILVGTGPGRAVIVTTDLTPDYVIFNGEPS